MCLCKALKEVLEERWFNDAINIRKPLRSYLRGCKCIL
ncbi:hypothetical protein [Vibrio phage vB_VibM_10AMN]|uniref:Uncharacterized protein n=1 Tax=Staphylococcus phage vB_VibM_10AMN12 TaxID=3076785 RepID=A0AA96R6M3_9CAUD|nr:hypothetical protein [Vibrio phage vB_VibM_10AMN]WNO47487.1 hypothetical protein [Staphylococcus phage vB_VibM_10AMN12]